MKFIHFSCICFSVKFFLDTETHIFNLPPVFQESLYGIYMPHEVAEQKWPWHIYLSYCIERVKTQLKKKKTSQEKIICFIFDEKRLANSNQFNS